MCNVCVCVCGIVSVTAYSHCKTPRRILSTGSLPLDRMLRLRHKQANWHFACIMTKACVVHVHVSSFQEEEEEEEDEDDIEAQLAEEFEEEEEEDEEEDETEEDATDRMRNDLEEIYDKDTNSLAAVQVCVNM